MQLDHLLFYVSNIDATEDFYTKCGFTNIFKDLEQVHMRLDSFVIRCFDQSKVHFKQDTAKEKGAGVFMHIKVDDVDEVYNDLVGRGLTPSSFPTNWPWGNREFAIKDPDGYRLVFFQKLVV